MKPSWRTTVGGLVAGFAALVLSSPDFYAHMPWFVRDIAGFLNAGGMVFMGISSRDSQVSKDDVTAVTTRLENVEAATGTSIPRQP